MNKKKQCGHLRCGEVCRFGKKPSKRYSIKRTPIKKKFYKINKNSEKRKQENKEYSNERVKWLAENPYCELKVPGVCKVYATEAHHPAGRVGHLRDWKIMKRACFKCHRWVHDNHEEALEMGLITPDFSSKLSNVKKI